MFMQEDIFCLAHYPFPFYLHIRKLFYHGCQFASLSNSNSFHYREGSAFSPRVWNSSRGVNACILGNYQFFTPEGEAYHAQIPQCFSLLHPSAWLHTCPCTKPWLHLEPCLSSGGLTSYGKNSHYKSAMPWYHYCPAIPQLSYNEELTPSLAPELEGRKMNTPCKCICPAPRCHHVQDPSSQPHLRPPSEPQLHTISSQSND